jgi:hypothetical protein
MMIKLIINNMIKIIINKIKIFNKKIMSNKQIKIILIIISINLQRNYKKRLIIQI